MSTMAEPEAEAVDAVSVDSDSCAAGWDSVCCGAGSVRCPVREAGACCAAGRSVTVGVGGGGGGGGASEETSAAVNAHSTSASTETVGEVVMLSASSVTLASEPRPELAAGTSGTAATLEALRVRASPDEATAANARLPEEPVTALPKTVKGVEGRQAARCRPVVRSVNALLDRKSTRLNSSHVAISYAVLC